MKHYKYKDYFKNIFPCLGYGLLCGSLVGTVIFFFKLFAKILEENSRYVYGFVRTNPWLIPVLAIGLVIAALGMNILHKKIPEVKGGGIPRSEGILRGVLPFKWLKTFLGTFFGSMISFFVGLPLGSEGPAVLIGTSIGGMCDKLSKSKSAWGRCIMTGGAGAGFAVATGAPLSAILFTLEEIHKKFTSMLMITVSISVISASLVNSWLCAAFDLSPSLFEFEALPKFDLPHVGYLLIFGVLTALAVGLFDGSVEWFYKITRKLSGRFAHVVKLIIFFILAGALGLVFDGAIYSGHDVIESVMVRSESLGLLFLLLTVRLAMMLLATNSAATGGIFIPTLAIGALFSAFFANLMLIIGLPGEYFTALVLLGMCAFLGGTLRAPITALIFFVEITGGAFNILFAAVVVFVVYFIVDLYDEKPFYDRVLASMEKAEHKDKTLTVKYFCTKVSKGAFVIGKPVRDILWPHASVIVSITRDGKDFSDTDNDGEKRLYEGDSIIIRARCYDEEEILDHLYDLMGREHEIEIA